MFLKLHPYERMGARGARVRALGHTAGLGASAGSSCDHSVERGVRRGVLCSPRAPHFSSGDRSMQGGLGCPPTGRRPEAGASAVSQGLGGASVSGFRLCDHTREVPAAYEPFFERLKGLRSPGEK